MSSYFAQGMRRLQENPEDPEQVGKRSFTKLLKRMVMAIPYPLSLQPLSGPTVVRRTGKTRRACLWKASPIRLCLPCPRSHRRVLAQWYCELQRFA